MLVLRVLGFKVEEQIEWNIIEKDIIASTYLTIKATKVSHFV